jgi:hypothetical protein
MICACSLFVRGVVLKSRSEADTERCIRRALRRVEGCVLAMLSLTNPSSYKGEFSYRPRGIYVE